jgi:hypothetical protein
MSSVHATSGAVLSGTLRQMPAAMIGTGPGMLFAPTNEKQICILLISNILDSTISTIQDEFA